MGQQSWEPDPGTPRLSARVAAGQELQLQRRGRQEESAKQPACHPSTSTIALPLQTNLSNWQILRGKRAAGFCSKASSPGSASVMNPVHQQHPDPRVKPAIRAPAQKAGQALPSASYNSTDVKKAWADLCQLRANSSYFAFFMHFAFLFQLSCQHLPAAVRTGGQNWQPDLGHTCWDDPGPHLLG